MFGLRTFANSEIGMVKISGENYIGNQRSAKGNVHFRTFDPVANKESEWNFCEATVEEINEAAVLSSEVFKIYRNTPPSERANFLDAIADEIEALGNDLLTVFCTESGLSESRARAERTRTIFQLRSFAGLLRGNDWKKISLDPAEPNRTPSPKPRLTKTRIPLGPVAVFGASNFPLAYSTAGGDTASALAAGCPVIVKSHPMHAGTGELVASAIVKAAIKTGMPNGVFSNLNSKGIEVGVHLVKHPAIKAVGFTGSIQGGRALFDLANQRVEPIPVFAEMGSVNPVVISPLSLTRKAEFWAGKYADSMTQSAGQFCTNPGILLVPDSKEAELFSQILIEKLDLIENQPMLHPSIFTAYSSKKDERLKENVVELISQKRSEKENSIGHVLARTSGVQFLKNTNLHKEVFGVFSLMVTYKDEVELTQIIELMEGQLTGTIIVEPEEMPTFNPVIEALKYRVGRIIFNGVPTGVEVCPSMHHGGPYPASTDARFTAVGTDAIYRWLRPISFQNFPEEFDIES